ncbi:MAG: hypothetical protein HND48_11830 [Chloroflexi bacterium]|nr:hypothetical protein [Chloroflexota bacterium]
MLGRCDNPFRVVSAAQHRIHRGLDDRNHVTNALTGFPGRPKNGAMPAGRTPAASPDAG